VNTNANIGALTVSAGSRCRSRNARRVLTLRDIRAPQGARLSRYGNRSKGRAESRAIYRVGAPGSYAALTAAAAPK